LKAFVVCVAPCRVFGYRLYMATVLGHLCFCFYYDLRQQGVFNNFLQVYGIGSSFLSVIIKGVKKDILYNIILLLLLLGNFALF
jgi:hypothetical protein